MNKTLTSALHSIRSLFPESLGTFQSSFNGEIKAVRYFNGPCLWVDGIQQSGPYIKSLWQNTIQVIPSLLTTTTPKILILGLGAGAMVPVLNSFFDRPQIVGVEIDPQMLFLARKYFNLDTFVNLKVIQENAEKIINQKSFSKNKFDLIFLDLYIGSKGNFDHKLIEGLHKSLNQNGLFVFNVFNGLKGKLDLEKHFKKMGVQVKFVTRVKFKQNEVVFFTTRIN